MALRTVGPMPATAAVTSTDCVGERNPRQNATNTFYKTWEVDFEARLEERPFQLLSKTELQPKTPHQEHGHLISRNRKFGTIIAATATRGNALRRELFDPMNCPVAEIDITEDSCCCRR